jgi:tetratricopeptide (TPR) repeat protein
VYELARTIALDGLGAEKVPAAQAEPDVHRGIQMVERLSATAPENERLKYEAALARWYTFRGRLLEQLGRIDDAAACHREAIRHDEWVLEHAPEPRIVRLVLASRRAELAGLLIWAGRRDEGRHELDRAADEFVGLSQERGPGPRGGFGLDVGLAHLAELYDRIGDDARAAQLTALSEELATRHPKDGPPRRGDDRPGSRGGPPRDRGAAPH